MPIQAHSVVDIPGVTTTAHSSFGSLLEVRYLRGIEWQRVRPPRFTRTALPLTAHLRVVKVVVNSF